MDYRTAVNPTYFTAQQTSFFLMQAQNEDAKTFIQTLSLANQFMKNSDKDKSGPSLFTPEEGKVIMDSTALGTEDAAQRYNEARKHSMGSSSIFNLTSGISTMEQLISILEENGMRVEKIPYVAPKQSFNMMKAFSPEIGAQLLELLQGYAMLKITPDTSYTAAPAIEGAREIENLQLRYTVSNNTLYIDVAGRIDTISAPALLECFETNKESVSRLQIDFSDLQYISSAGLRVLMIAYKALGKGNVAIRGMSPVVRNIFETTGFVEFFDLS